MTMLGTRHSLQAKTNSQKKKSDLWFSEVAEGELDEGGQAV